MKEAESLSPGKQERMGHAPFFHVRSGRCDPLRNEASCQHCEKDERQ
jgi:hypothetical protein